MKIAFVTLYDARDVTRMSGTGHHISRALAQRGADIHYIGPLKPQYHPVNLARYVWNHHVLGRNDHPQRDPGFLRHYARQVEAALRETEVDVILASGGLPVAYLETDLPLVLWTDCTFASLRDYYDKWSNLSRRTLRNGQAAEQALFDRCDWVIMTSQWAADSAVKDYGFDDERISVIPRGANLPALRTWDETAPLLGQRPSDRCRLLFIGLRWKRKRGDLVLEAAKLLNARGLPTTLTIVGCRPQVSGPLPDFVEVTGYLSKANAKDRDRLHQLLGRSHFLVLPTRADCTRTGAVPSVVTDGRNGRLFDVDAAPAEYADCVADLMADRPGYEVLCRSSFDDYRTRLNWDVNGRRAVEVLRHVAAMRRKA